MSEQNDHGQNTNDTFREIISREDTALSALVQFDEQRHGLYENLALTVTKLSDEDYQPGTVEFTTTIEFEPIRNLFTSILNHFERDDAMSMIKELFKSDSNERVSLLRSMIGEDDECIEFFEDETLDDLITASFTQADNLEDAIESIVDMYVMDLESDLEIFHHHMQQLHPLPNKSAEEDDKRTIELIKGPYEHAIDIAKIAAGVSIALAVDRLMRRKQS